MQRATCTTHSLQLEGARRSRTDWKLCAMLRLVQGKRARSCLVRFTEHSRLALGQVAMRAAAVALGHVVASQPHLAELERCVCVRARERGTGLVRLFSAIRLWRAAGIAMPRKAL